MKNLKFIVPLLLMTSPLCAKEEIKNYSCQFSSGMGYKKVDITFDKEIGNSFSSAVKVEKANGEKEVLKFRSKLKISKEDGTVYAENKNNSSINPFSDVSYLKFDGMKKTFGYEDLGKDLSLSLYTLSGPVGNRSSWTTRLTCALETQTPANDLNDPKVFNGSRNEIKAIDNSGQSLPAPTPLSTKEK